MLSPTGIITLYFYGSKSSEDLQGSPGTNQCYQCIRRRNGQSRHKNCVKDFPNERSLVGSLWCIFLLYRKVLCFENSYVLNVHKLLTILESVTRTNWNGLFETNFDHLESVRRTNWNGLFEIMDPFFNQLDL